MALAILYHIHRKGNLDLSDGYIGVTTESLKRRFNRHSRNTCPTLHEALKTFDDIEIREIERGDKGYCLLVERQLRPRDLMGWNYCAGGSIPPSVSEGIVGDKTRAAISKRNREWVRSEETRSKIGAAHTGKIISDEHKKKIREFNIGSKRTEEVKLIISEKAKNRAKKECPHCKANISVNVYARYHDENCKLKGV